MSRSRLDASPQHRLVENMLGLHGCHFGTNFHAHLHEWQNPLGFQPNRALENAVRQSALGGNEQISLLINIDLLMQPLMKHLFVSLTGVDFPSLLSIEAHAGLHACGIFS